MINPSIILYHNLYSRFQSSWISCHSTQCTYLICFLRETQLAAVPYKEMFNKYHSHMLKAFLEKSDFHSILSWHVRKDKSQYFLGDEKKNHPSIILKMIVSASISFTLLSGFCSSSWKRPGRVTEPNFWHHAGLPKNQFTCLDNVLSHFLNSGKQGPDHFCRELVWVPDQPLDEEHFPDIQPNPTHAIPLGPVTVIREQSSVLCFCSL